MYKVILLGMFFFINYESSGVTPEFSQDFDSGGMGKIVKDKKNEYLKFASDYLFCKFETSRDVNDGAEYLKFLEKIKLLDTEELWYEKKVYAEIAIDSMNAYGTLSRALKSYPNNHLLKVMKARLLYEATKQETKTEFFDNDGKLIRVRQRPVFLNGNGPLNRGEKKSIITEAQRLVEEVLTQNAPPVYAYYVSAIISEDEFNEKMNYDKAIKLYEKYLSLVKNVRINYARRKYVQSRINKLTAQNKYDMGKYADESVIFTLLHDVNGGKEPLALTRYLLANGSELEISKLQFTARSIEFSCSKLKGNQADKLSQLINSLESSEPIKIEAGSEVVTVKFETKRSLVHYPRQNEVFAKFSRNIGEIAKPNNFTAPANIDIQITDADKVDKMRLFDSRRRDFKLKGNLDDVVSFIAEFLKKDQASVLTSLKIDALPDSSYQCSGHFFSLTNLMD